jgi:hypothetical protein
MKDMFAGMEESLSPRERWVKNHGVTVSATEDEHGPKWTASLEGKGAVISRESREDALKRLAQWMWINLAVKPWNWS